MHTGTNKARIMAGRRQQGATTRLAATLGIPIQKTNTNFEASN
jgi:hypothetical protein